jgi:sialate O-acetylesterase
MPPLFSDNMVLQRGRASTFWGVGAPGTSVTLAVGASRRPVTTTVRADGSWRLAFQPPAGPGPHEIRVTAADTVVRIANVLVGEVWLCSGQSNMEMPLSGWPPGSPVAGSDSAITAANQPAMRLFQVTHRLAAMPDPAFGGAWVECTPATAASFGATAFFFGRALHDALGTPVGLIQSTWGGTPVEAWMSREALAAFPEFRDPLRQVTQLDDTLAALNRWLGGHRTLAIDEAVAGRRWEDVTLGDETYARADFDDRAWRTVGVPGDWEDRGLGTFDGIAWYRRSVTIPQAWVGHTLTLRLGPIDDMDRTYVNGTLVGGMMGLDHWRTPRVYTVPESLVRGTELGIAVRVVDFMGGGGLWGDGHPVDVFAGDSTAAIPLTGEWRLMPVAEYFAPTLYDYGAPASDFASRPRLPIGLGAGTPTALYNGMLGPLVPFAIRGVTWYQGEENVARSASYRRLFSAMIADWRRAFSVPGLPFYYVQIAPFDYGPGANSALLREAQLQALRVPNTGMAVTLDVGDAKDVHPRHKREAGERLAAWALAKTYGRSVPFSGPLYRSMRREPGRIVLEFDAVEGGLVLKTGPQGSGFEIAGSDGRFVPAEAQVRGRTLVVSSASIPAPTAVRYAFTDTPTATLFNSAGLPASSFRTEAPAPEK